MEDGVELVDPTEDGARIRDALAERGFALLSTSAPLLIVALDTEEGRKRWAHLNEPGGRVPTVIAIGDPPDPEAVPALHLIHYHRPVPVRRLLRRVETLLTPPETRLRPSGAPRRSASEEELPELDPIAATPRSRRRDGFGFEETQKGFPPVEALHPTSNDPSQRLSPEVESLILSADNRLFQDEPPLDLRFPSAEQSAAELVPDGLLEPDEPSMAGPASEAFGMLTGTMPTEEVIQDVQTGTSREAGSVPPLDNTAVTVTEAPRLSGPDATGIREAVVREPASASDEQRVDERPEAGPVERAGLLDVLELLWRSAARHRPLHIALDAQAELHLWVDRGRVRRFEGPSERMAIERLRAEGRLKGSLSSLSSAVASGQLTRFEAARAERRAREALLFAALGSESVQARVETADAAETTETGLGRRLRPLLLEALRRHVTPLRAETLLGRGAVSLDPGARRRLAEAEVEPELSDVILAGDGTLLTDLMASAPVEAGLAGALVLLAAVGGMRVRDDAVNQDPEAAAGFVAAAVQDIARLARDGSYFQLLDVGWDASAEDVERCAEARRRMLLSVDLPLAGYPDLEVDRGPSPRGSRRGGLGLGGRPPSAAVPRRARSAPADTAWSSGLIGGG